LLRKRKDPVMGLFFVHFFKKRVAHDQ